MQPNPATTAVKTLEYASRVLLVSIGVLAAIHLFIELVPLPDYPGDIMLRRLLDFSSERSMITWLSAVMWYSSAALAATVAIIRASHERSDARWWAAFALVPLVISIDEIAGIHETLSEHIRQWSEIGGLAAASWVIPEILLGFAILACFLPFIRRLPRWLQARLVLAAGVSATGAVGLELMSFFAYDAEELGRTSRVYAVTSAAEETLEMLGAYILIVALVRSVAIEAHAAGSSRSKMSTEPPGFGD